MHLYFNYLMLGHEDVEFVHDIHACLIELMILRNEHVDNIDDKDNHMV